MIGHGFWFALWISYKLDPDFMSYFNFIVIVSFLSFFYLSIKLRLQMMNIYKIVREAYFCILNFIVIQKLTSKFKILKTMIIAFISVKKSYFIGE